MATSYLTLGQVSPSASTETQLYLVPSSTSAIVSSLVVCNQAATAATYRVAVVKSGGTTSPAAALSWIVYGATIAANDSTILTIGIAMSAGDQIRVYSSSATLSFNAYGSQIV